MLTDPSKRVRFFSAIRLDIFVCFLCVVAGGPIAASEDAVSNLKRQFVKTFLKAEQGDPAAQYDVGMMYYSGQQVPQDKGLAAVWMTKAAEQGHPPAQYFLSLMYGLGDGVSQNDQTAAAWCQKAADQGYAEAQYALGRMYATGQGLPQDDARAVMWYTKAAQQGHADAQCDLGMMYQSGRGVRRDINQAVQWWVKASQQGHAWSGLLLQENMEPKSSLTAKNTTDTASNEADLLLDSIEQDLGLLEDYEPVQTAKIPNQPKAPVSAGSTAERRSEPSVEDASGKRIVSALPEEVDKTESDMVITGTIPSAEESIDLRPQTPVEVPVPPRLPVETQDPSAQYAQAVKYYEGVGVERDYAQAFEWFKKAAEQGHTEAQYKLGVMYSFGQGAAQNTTEAVYWFRQAAEEGLAAAQYSLGVMYGTGQGVPLDPEAAAQWYTRAANQGSVAAQFMLGLVYSKGQGVTRDSAAAVQWYTKAAEQGSPSAQYVLAVIYDKGQGLVLQDEQQALKWYTRAAEAGHADAQYDLATKYANGQGVERDYVTAYMWCLVAGLNDKDVMRLENWLEPRMSDDQLERARQRAREIHDRNTPPQAP